jgi:serine/threonine protein kinase
MQLPELVDEFERKTNTVLEDVKPANIMFNDKSKNKLVLIDFGGAASFGDGINIYSSPFTRSSLLSKLENNNISKVKESHKDSYIAVIKTIQFLETEILKQEMN